MTLFWKKKKKKKRCVVWYGNGSEVMKIIKWEVAEITHKEYSKAQI